SQLGQAGGQVIDAAAQVGVHQSLLESPPVATGGFYDKHSNAGRQFGLGETSARKGRAMGKLDDKSALVTGGGSGIGLESARALLGEGANVAIAGRDADKLRRAATDLNGGDRLLVHAANVTDKAQVAALVDAVTRRFGRIGILVNNAG